MGREVESVRLRLLLAATLRLMLGGAFLAAAPKVRVARAWRHLVDASLPSTVGLATLAGVTLTFQPTLTALLGGILAGLGLTAILVAHGIDGGSFSTRDASRVSEVATRA